MKVVGEKHQQRQRWLWKGNAVDALGLYMRGVGENTNNGSGGFNLETT